eukprot:gene7870-7937_t
MSAWPQQSWPYADLQAYDDVIQAATGTTTLLPRADGNPAPRYLPSLIADKVAGLHGAYAILAAVVHKLRFGGGQFVEVPMFESFAHFMAQEHLFGATLVPPIEPAGYPRQIDPFRQPFPTADGHISLVPYTDAALQRVFALLDAEHLLTEPRFATPKDRAANISQAYAEIALRTPARSNAEWAQIFAEHQIPAMPVRDLADLTTDPHLAQVGLFQQRTHPSEGDYLHLKAPVTFSAGTCATGPAPTIGQDNVALGAPPPTWP